MSDYDYLVCGSGIAGASIASELAREGRVLVVDQEDAAGYHTTGRSAAMFIGSYGNAMVRRLTAASRAFFEASDVTDQPLLTKRGCLTIATGDQTSHLETMIAALTESGAPFQEVDAQQARALAPVLVAGAVARGVFEPDACDIDTNGLHTGFLRLARTRGAEMRLNARVEQIEREASAWSVRLAGDQTVLARVIVNAAGAWCDRVATLAGVAELGLQPKRRTAILIDAPAGADIAGWPVVIDAEEQFYFKPESGRLLASPADETPSEPVDAAPEELDIAICVDRVQAVVDFPIRRVIRSWAGLRTFAADRSPVYGYDPRSAGFFWFSGQGGFGMQTSPAAARLGAALVLGQPLPPDLLDHGLTAEMFSPARFSEA